jgi:hypothetical protein
MLLLLLEGQQPGHCVAAVDAAAVEGGLAVRERQRLRKLTVSCKGT